MTSFGHKGRLEDERMLKGKGRYVSDWTFPNQAYGYFLRSDRPHAEIASIDTSSALALPGVIAVLTGDDVIAAGQKPMPAAAPMKGRGGSDQVVPPRYSLTRGKVRYVGEPVALVIAESAAAAQDAAEQIFIEWNELPAVITAERRKFWSFQPIRKPALPSVRDARWVKSPIDRFILSRLEADGLTPVKPADERTLIRRAIRRLLLVAPRAALEPLGKIIIHVLRQQGLQPFPGVFQNNSRFSVTNPFRLLVARHQPGKEQEGHHHDDQAAGQPEQEAERAVERADPAVEHLVGHAKGDQAHYDQGDDEHAGGKDDLLNAYIVDVRL